MNTTPSPHTVLADLYRRARTLASEETAQPGQTAALYEATSVLFSDSAGSGGGNADAGPQEKRLETLRGRVRRIAIIALRRQALAARQAWVDQGGPTAGTGAEATAPLAQALTFGEAALTLHRDGDAARDNTRRLVAFLRSTLTIAQFPPKASRLQPVAAPVPAEAAAAPPPTAAPAEVELLPEAQVFVAGVPPSEEQPAPRVRGPRPDRSDVPHRPVLLPALAVIAVVGFIAGFVVAPRILRGGPPPRQEVRIARPAVLPSPSATMGHPLTTTPAGGAAPAQTAAVQVAPKATTAAGTKVALVLRSEPAGAQVFIGGVWQGATPLRLEAVPGTQLRLVVRRGTRVWRGMVRVGERSGQVLTVRLPESGAVTARSTPPPPPPTPAPTPASAAVASARHFDGLMAQGVELYRGGWYGPAMARFRAASAVRPEAPSPYLWYARAAVRVGRVADARRALERVIAIAPTSSAAREAQLLLNRLK